MWTTKRKDFPRFKLLKVVPMRKSEANQALSIQTGRAEAVAR